MRRTPGSPKNEIAGLSNHIVLIPFLLHDHLFLAGFCRFKNGSATDGLPTQAGGVWIA